MSLGFVHDHTSPDQAPVSRHISVIYASGTGFIYTSQQSAAIASLQWNGATSADGPSSNAESQQRHDQRESIYAVSRRVSYQWLLVRNRTCKPTTVISISSTTGTGPKSHSGTATGASDSGSTSNRGGLRLRRLRGTKNGEGRDAPVRR